MSGVFSERLRVDLPTVLYRCPGSISRAGGTWDYLGVETVEAHKAATAQGWHPSMPEAIEAYENKRAAVIAEVEKEAVVRNKPGPKPKPKV